MLPEAAGGLSEGGHPDNLVDHLYLSMSAGPAGVLPFTAPAATLLAVSLADWRPPPLKSLIPYFLK